MRLLYLTPRLPWPPNRGGEIIIFNFLKYLSRRHEIALVSFYDRPEELEQTAALREYCVRIETVRRPTKLAPAVLVRCLAGGHSYSVARHTSAEYRRRVTDVLRTWPADLAQVEIFFMGAYLPELGRIPTVLHMHDVTWVMWDRLAAVAPAYLRPLVRTEAARIRRDELAVCRTVDVCVPVSDTDRRHLQAAAPEVRADVVVPGVDTHALTPVSRPPSTTNLVFVGSMHYLPNVDAAEFFVREILPRIAREVPDVTLTIVGSRPSPAVRRLADDPRVRVTGEVPDVRPYYAAAAAAVVPLRIAGGVRMKILEAMALGVPIVSTTIGAEGLGLTDGEECLLADGVDAFAAAAIRLLRNAPFANALAARGRAAAVQRFSWEAVGRALEAVYHSLVPSGAAR